MDYDHHGNQVTNAGWREQWDGLPVTLNVPWITPEERWKCREHSTRTVYLPETLLERLQQMVQRHDHTLQAILLAALQVILYRYTYDEVFVVAACKNDAGKHPVSTLCPYKADLTGNPTCRDLLVRVQHALSEVRATPFSDCHVVSWLALCHDTSELDMADLQECADIGLIFLLEQRPARCLIIHAPSLLPDWFVEQWFRHFLIILGEFCRDLEQSIHTLTLLTVREQTQLREKWIGESRPYPLSNKLHQLFEEQAARTPDAVAIIYPSRQGETVYISYRMLNRHANEVARELMRRGVKQNGVVGVYLARSPYAVVALLAILKAGGIYLPMDMVYPLEHLQIMLIETEAPILLTTTEMQKRVQDLSVQIVCVEEFERYITSDSDENLQNATTTDDLAIIMYTSGTTGKPKGVRHRQRQIVNRLYWMWEYYPFQPGDVACQRSPLGVMPSMWELLGGLLKGIPTLLVPDELIRDTPRFVSTLAEHGVSYITLVPSLLQLILNCQKEISRLKECLRLVTLGGEALSAELYQRFRATLPKTFLLNDYGCTEVNTILYYTLTSADKDPGIFPGSRPVANLEVYILDANQQLVPAGVQGELCIGGVAVSTGYLKRPELTREKFISHPFRPGAANYLYRTGDLAYFLPDGTIRLLGRQDHQVKINGMRIELEGVEIVLCQHSQVREGAVVARTLENGARQLHAFLVPSEGTTVDEEALRDFLAEHLPSFMVPACYNIVTSLPRTPGGKLDRHALSTMLSQMQLGKHSPHLPDSSLLVMELRQLLARQVLETSVDAIGAEQDFYLLGLDSVLMAEFARKLSERFGFACSVTSLYDHSTVKKLAAYILEELQKQQLPDDKALSLYQETQAVVPEVPAEQQTVLSEERSVSPDEDIAIIGVSGRFPQASDLTRFWHNLAHGVDSVIEVPGSRWRIDDYYDADLQQNAKTVSRWGAFLYDIDKFEPLFFSIAPAEAKWMDPQQRLCLEESWKAVEDAGYAADQLSACTVGVFIGAKKGDYAESVRGDQETPQGYALLGTDPALIAARIAYHLNLHGPCLTIDTACSSSLVAVHLACQSIKSNECEMALAGGVCVMTEPTFSVATSKLGILSPTGKCRPFDNAADGFVQGEGVAFIVLKALKKARQDGDTIYGVIKASATNHDGKTNGIGAPSGLAQTRLQSALYQKSGIDPVCISYVEAHGTGTKIGDPIEIKALTNAFQLFTQKKQYCAIGSLKSNIGHLTAAAGIAGLIKILLCFKHKQLLPSIHFTTPNEHIDFADSPFYVNTRLQTWDVLPGVTRMAALNSFGLGGTNVHCVLEEPLECVRPTKGIQPSYLVLISARTVHSLRQKLSDLQTWLASEEPRYTLRDISYTLLVGRKHFSICCVYCATDLHDLAEQLAQSLDGTELSGPFCQLQAQLPDLDPLLKELGKYLVLALGMLEMSREEYEQKVCVLANLIARGFRFDGTLLFKAEKGYRIPLPTYPFLKERHWFRENAAPVAATKATEQLGPALAEGRVPPERISCTNMDSGMSNGQISDDIQLELQLRRILARLLGIDKEMLATKAPLDEYGFDSLRAVTLKYELEKHFACEVPIEFIGQSRTLHEMSLYLAALPSAQGKQPAQLAQDEQFKQQFLHGEVSLSALKSDELDRLFGLFARDIERVHNET